MKIVFIGDLHVSTNHEWSEASFVKFSHWFLSQDWGHKEYCAIFLGDIFDKSCNYGNTIRLVTAFFKAASDLFCDIFILGGNHDLSFHKGDYQYATAYLQNSFENITCIFEEEIWTIDGATIGLLPFKRVNGMTLEKYYSENLHSNLYNCDVTCGHVALKEEGTFFGGIDHSKFKTKFVLGHIHTRSGKYKSEYTGSILPFKINENQTELPRCLKIYDTNTKSFSEMIIPEIVSFEEANFGDKLQNFNDNKVHLYTIKNCKHLQEAKSTYPKNYIYNIEKPKINDINILSEKQNILMTPEQALSMMIKEQKLVMKRKTLQIVKELI
jgi:DNA repair exonuclease SbcCD nuclease subunit